jgi:hypothetical protein
VELSTEGYGDASASERQGAQRLVNPSLSAKILTQPVALRRRPDEPGIRSLGDTNKIGFTEPCGRSSLRSDRGPPWTRTVHCTRPLRIVPEWKGPRQDPSSGGEVNGKFA